MEVMRFTLAACLGLAALPALSGAALADSREEVLLRLPRCSAIGEQRQYLDCYYAAVEPMRAELGLAAAPQGASYAPLFSLGSAPAASAGGVSQQSLAVREEVLLRLTRCASIGDTRQYLDCYYAAVQPIRAELGLAAAPQAASYAPLFSLAQVAPRPASVPDNRPNLVPQSAYANASTRVTGPPRLEGDAGATKLPWIGTFLGIRTVKVPEEQFGLKNAKPGPGINVDHIAARLSKVQVDRDSGSFTVTLDNGQVWRQVMNDDMRQHWDKNIVGAVATVAYGAGLTFNLSVGEGVLYKVERVS